MRKYRQADRQTDRQRDRCLTTGAVVSLLVAAATT